MRDVPHVLFSGSSGLRDLIRTAELGCDDCSASGVDMGLPLAWRGVARRHDDGQAVTARWPAL